MLGGDVWSETASRWWTRGKEATSCGKGGRRKVWLRKVVSVLRGGYIAVERKEEFEKELKLGYARKVFEGIPEREDGYTT